MAPRLVRRQPLWDRIKSALDPYDLLLWLAEELHDSTWDEALKDWTLPIGAATNLVFVIARANSVKPSAGNADVFGDFEGRSSSGWFTWLSAFISHLLSLLCFLNAAYAFNRKRHYRLFETSIDETPSTPSARRVNVNSSPASGSPLRYLSNLVSSASAQSRAHPDQKRDVWEIGVWDPKEVNLELFCLFSPGHVLIYWLFLPTTSSDPRPSVTVVTSILLSALLSAQLVALRQCFTQQAKDLKVISKQVMNEYDTKFVHPNLNRPVRDVGTQTSHTSMSAGTTTREVDVYTPTTIINRGFSVNPNPSYASHLSQETTGEAESPSFNRLPRSSTTPNLFTPMHKAQLGGFSRVASPFPARPSLGTPSRSQQSFQRPPSPSKGDGGSLGVFLHAASPLKKAASSSHLRPSHRPDVQSAAKNGSPLKRMSVPGEGLRHREDRHGSDRDRPQPGRTNFS